jgi:hypothetical protein
MQNRVTHRRPLVGLALAFVVLVVVGVAIVNIRRPILQALGASSLLMLAQVNKVNRSA